MQGGIKMSIAYIVEAGSSVSCNQKSVIVSYDGMIQSKIAINELKGVIIGSHVTVAPEVIIKLLKKNITLTWVSNGGKYYGNLQSISNSNEDIRQKQIELQYKPDIALELSKKIVTAKIQNQITILRRYNRNRSNEDVVQAIEHMNIFRKNISNVANADKLRGLEGITAKYYFHALGKLVDKKFSFDKRSKRPPKDPFNSLLSLGYTMVGSEVYAAVMACRLDPYFGFMHTLRGRHPALVSDLLEEWRAVIVDSLVMALVQGHEILPKHFVDNGKKKGIQLTQEGKICFCQAYEKKMTQYHQYHQKKLSFREILFCQVETFSDAITKMDTTLYEPLKIR